MHWREEFLFLILLVLFEREDLNKGFFSLLCVERAHYICVGVLDFIFEKRALWSSFSLGRDRGVVS